MLPRSGELSLETDSVAWLECHIRYHGPVMCTRHLVGWRGASMLDVCLHSCVPESPFFYDFKKGIIQKAAGFWGSKLRLPRAEQSGSDLGKNCFGVVQAKKQVLRIGCHLGILPLLKPGRHFSF